MATTKGKKMTKPPFYDPRKQRKDLGLQYTGESPTQAKRRKRKEMLAKAGKKGAKKPPPAFMR